MDTYREENNHTGYPLNGGAKPIVSPEQEEKYAQLKAEFDALKEDYLKNKEELGVEKAKNVLLEKHSTELLQLLQVSMSQLGYQMPFKPFEFYYGDGPKDNYGMPVVTCNTQNQTQTPWTRQSSTPGQPK